MNKTIKDFRDGIFELHTVRFGAVAEIMIKKIFSLENPTNNFHDLKDPVNGDRIEVKFSRVRKSHSSAIREHNVIAQCLAANISYRMVNSDDVLNVKFDSNIQQIKTSEFEVLYYGLFFADQIAIFKLHTSEIASTIGYSDFQHKGNIGEGQFHINPSTWEHHLNNLEMWISYEKLYEIFSK